jgi:hypothetical protein
MAHSSNCHSPNMAHSSNCHSPNMAHSSTCHSPNMAHSSTCKPHQQIFLRSFQFSVMTETLPSSESMASTYRTSRWYNNKEQHNSNLILCLSIGIIQNCGVSVYCASIWRQLCRWGNSITLDHTRSRTCTQFSKPSGHSMYRRVVTICTAEWSLYVPHSGHCMYRTVVTICTTSLTFNNSTFCPHTVFMCFVWISEQTAIISLYNIN